jgi:hypothetical protein
MARSAIGAHRRAPGAVGLRFPVSSRTNPPTNSLQLTSDGQVGRNVNGGGVRQDDLGTRVAQ